MSFPYDYRLYRLVEKKIIKNCLLIFQYKCNEIKMWDFYNELRKFHWGPSSIKESVTTN